MLRVHVYRCASGVVGGRGAGVGRQRATGRYSGRRVHRSGGVIGWPRRARDLLCVARPSPGMPEELRRAPADPLRRRRAATSEKEPGGRPETAGRGFAGSRRRTFDGASGRHQHDVVSVDRPHGSARDIVT